MSNKLDIFIFIDALGWELVERNHFMEKEFPYRKHTNMQFGYSCTAIPTILTGKTPAEHKHLGLFRYDPEHSPFKCISWLDIFLKPASLWNRGRVRHWLSKIVKFVYRYTGYFQLYQMPFKKLGLMDYCEKRNLFKAHGLEDVPNLEDVLSKTKLNYHISNWHLSDKDNITEACKAIEKGASFLFVYNAELDSVMHNSLLDFPVVKKKLDFYEVQLIRLFQAAKHAGKDLHLTVISDHGMTPLTHTLDIMSVIEALPLKFGKDYGACYDSTMARFTYKNDKAKQLIRQAMEQFTSEGTWLDETKEKEFGIYREDRHFGDEIFLVKTGIQIAPSDMGIHPLNGMHGFDPYDIYSQASVLSTHPIPEYVKNVSNYFQFMMESINEQTK